MLFVGVEPISTSGVALFWDEFASAFPPMLLFISPFCEALLVVLFVAVELFAAAELFAAVELFEGVALFASPVGPEQAVSAHAAHKSNGAVM